MVTTEVSLEKNADMKRMQVNVLENYSKDDKETVCSYHVTYAF